RGSSPPHPTKGPPHIPGPRGGRVVALRRATPFQGARRLFRQSPATGEPMYHPVQLDIAVLSVETGPQGPVSTDSTAGTGGCRGTEVGDRRAGVVGGRPRDGLRAVGRRDDVADVVGHRLVRAAGDGGRYPRGPRRPARVPHRPHDQ